MYFNILAHCVKKSDLDIEGNLFTKVSPTVKAMASNVVTFDPRTEVRGERQLPGPPAVPMATDHREHKTSYHCFHGNQIQNLLS